jgi:exodeoxyribonuclease VII small subunit
MPPAAGDEGFDHVVERLKSLVEKLEHGSLSLEDSLKTFEEGVSLARKGHAILDAAEKRVELLVRGPEGEQIVPFPRQNGNGAGGGGSPEST